MLKRVDLFEEVSIKKHPGSTVDFVFDWSEWLGNDTIIESAWEFPLEGILNVLEDFTGTTTEVWIKDGDPREAYRITNKVETAEGRIEIAALNVYVTAVGGK